MRSFFFLDKRIFFHVTRFFMCATFHIVKIFSCAQFPHIFAISLWRRFFMHANLCFTAGNKLSRPWPVSFLNTTSIEYAFHQISSSGTGHVRGQGSWIAHTVILQSAKSYLTDTNRPPGPLPLSMETHIGEIYIYGPGQIPHYLSHCVNHCTFCHSRCNKKNTLFGLF